MRWARLPMPLYRGHVARAMGRGDGRAAAARAVRASADEAPLGGGVTPHSNRERTGARVLAVLRQEAAVCGLTKGAEGGNAPSGNTAAAPHRRHLAAKRKESTKALYTAMKAAFAARVAA